jgi:hypothetical protein
MQSGRACAGPTPAADAGTATNPTATTANKAATTDLNLLVMTTPRGWGCFPQHPSGAGAKQ